MLLKVFIVVFMLGIVYALFSSFYFMLNDKGEGDRVVRRLSWRIGLSLLFIVSLWGAVQLGWIVPNSG